MHPPHHHHQQQHERAVVYGSDGPPASATGIGVPQSRGMGGQTTVSGDGLAMSGMTSVEDVNTLETLLSLNKAREKDRRLIRFLIVGLGCTLVLLALLVGGIFALLFFNSSNASATTIAATNPAPAPVAPLIGPGPVPAMVPPSLAPVPLSTPTSAAVPLVVDNASNPPPTNAAVSAAAAIATMSAPDVAKTTTLAPSRLRAPPTSAPSVTSVKIPV
jgi:hypothetical protein